MSPIQLEDQDVVEFLTGLNTVRDGALVGLSVLPGELEWDPEIQLTFSVPEGTHGDHYVLTLSGAVKFEYTFSSRHILDQIAFMKCLWTEDDRFYLSLEPWKESEPVVSDQDEAFFLANSVKLAVSRTVAAD